MTLVNDILYQALARELHGARSRCRGQHVRVTGMEAAGQGVCGVRGPGADRADPAVEPGDLHLGCSIMCGSCLRRPPEAKVRGYQPGRFSFNVKGGRGVRRARRWGPA